MPGWVLITVMTAGLIAVVWGFAGDRLADAFQSAINRALGNQP